MVEKPFFERYRGAIIGLVVVAAVGLMAVWAFGSASAASYSCEVEWVPAPTRSPGPDASPQPGYVQEQMGAGHVGPGTTTPNGFVNYLYCPPASGDHYERGGPVQPRVYGPGERAIPQGWIHNLEHGGLVVLYRADPGDPGPTEAVQQQFSDFYANMPPSPVCGFAPGREGAGVTIAQFDEMATPFAALVWGRALPLQTFDEAAVMQFWNTYGERTNPEKFCAEPSPDASPSPS
jgi:hypothetical protein